MPALVVVIPVEGTARTFIDASEDDDQRLAYDLFHRDVFGDIYDALAQFVDGPCEGAS